ncbi:MAG: NosD domain-containing protein, partial [Candidatus Bathyarchaeia archaeon]
GPSIAVKASSNSILIERCSFNQSYIGLSVFEAMGITFRFNTVHNAKRLVVKLYPQALNVTIYMNNFLGEAEAVDAGSGNSWFNSTLRLGNYWSTWKSTEEDADGDGIIDEPKPIEGTANAVDRYPLAKQFQEYVTESRQNGLQKYLVVLIAVTLAIILILVAGRKAKTHMAISSQLISDD